jgi:hypothetical protein
MRNLKGSQECTSESFFDLSFSKANLNRMHDVSVGPN